MPSPRGATLAYVSSDWTPLSNCLQPSHIYNLHNWCNARWPLRWNNHAVTHQNNHHIARLHNTHVCLSRTLEDWSDLLYQCNKVRRIVVVGIILPFEISSLWPSVFGVPRLLQLPLGISFGERKSWSSRTCRHFGRLVFWLGCFVAQRLIHYY
jgi:hypothetical protein